MTLIAVMAIMVLFATALLAVAPTVQMEVQREKELESIRRGEEIADAIRKYVVFYRGSKLPETIDDLLEGLPQGTKKLQILRPSAATDPLADDGKWGLVKPEPSVVAAFAKRVQTYNNGLLPPNPSPLLDRFAVVIVNNVNTETTDDASSFDALDIDFPTDNTPFIGVVSRSHRNSVLTYYGIDNHSKWIFTPLFRGSGQNVNFGDRSRPPVPPRSPQPPRE
ncbi:MAG: hypothetical protein ABI539_13605 [Acidobacteriota bacterium]